MKTSIAFLLALPVLAGPADFPAPDGFEPAGGIMRFDTQGLFRVIDGAAELYVDYGFRELTARDFSRGDLKIVLNVFDMGDPLNAYGIYQRQRPEKAETVSAGTEAASAPPYQCQLVKGPYYVKVDVHKGKLTREACRAIVEAAAKSLPGSKELPAPFALLPGTHRIAGSIGYARKDYLGLAELTRCVHATYRAPGGEQYLVFSLVTDDPDAAWKKLAAKWKPVETGGREILVRKVPYRGDVFVTRANDGIVGVASAGDTPLSRDFLLGVLRGTGTRSQQ